jgi:hypothetical protein
MPTKYGTANEVEGYQQTVAQIDAIQSNPYLISQIADQREMKDRRKNAQALLDKRKAPEPKDGVERDTIRSRQSLLEGFIKLECDEIKKPAMPSQHEMEETPVGAVGNHMIWENKLKNYTLDPNGNPIPAKEGYGAIFEWKDNQRRLRGDAEEMDRDIANVEQLRPKTADKSSFADYRKIVFGTDPIYRAAYDKAFPDHEPTPVEAKIIEAKPRCGKPKANGDPCNCFIPCRHHAVEVVEEKKEEAIAV